MRKDDVSQKQMSSIRKEFVQRNHAMQPGKAMSDMYYRDSVLAE